MQSPQNRSKSDPPTVLEWWDAENMAAQIAGTDFAQLQCPAFSSLSNDAH